MSSADSFAPTTNPELHDAYREALENLGKHVPAPSTGGAGKTQVIVGVAANPDEVWDAVGANCLHEITVYSAWLRRGFQASHWRTFLVAR